MTQDQSGARSGRRLLLVAALGLPIALVGLVLWEPDQQGSEQRVAEGPIVVSTVPVVAAEAPVEQERIQLAQLRMPGATDATAAPPAAPPAAPAAGAAPAPVPAMPAAAGQGGVQPVELARYSCQDMMLDLVNRQMDRITLTVTIAWGLARVKEDPSNGRLDFAQLNSLNEALWKDCAFGDRTRQVRDVVAEVLKKGG